MGNSLKAKVISGVLWKFAESVSSQGVSFVVSVVLARLLMPEDFGTISIVTVFIGLANVFVTSGFAVSLIQKKDATDTDFSTIFYCSFVVSLLMYTLLFICAPYIAAFYDDLLLTPVIRIFALRLPLSVYGSIQHAYISRKMIFKKSFLSSLVGTISSGIIGIIMAYKGFGVWALIAQNFAATIIGTIVLSITIPWHLKLKFSLKSARQMMKYGSRILLADLSGTFFGQLRNLIVGKFYSPADLAYYNRGMSLPSLVSSNLSGTISSVLFPAMANSNDLQHVKAMTRRSIKIMAYLMFPAMTGVALVAEEMVLLLYTEKWVSVIPYLQMLSIGLMIGTIGLVPLQTLKAIGRSDAVFNLEIYKKPVYVVLLLIGVRHSVYMIALTMMLYDMYGCCVNMMQLWKHIDYKLKEQIADLMPSGIAALCMAFCVFVIPSLGNLYVQLAVKIIVGVVVYIAVSIVTRNDMFLELKQMLVQFVGKRRG